MSKQVTITYSITYDLRQGEVAEEYLDQLGDYEDTVGQRSWFAIDRFIGHHNLALFDSQATLHLEEN